MLFDWTKINDINVQQVNRPTRHSAELRAVLTLPFESWQLMWTLKTINISATGVLCGLNVTDIDSAQRALDLNALLDAQPEVTLQIDSPTDDTFAPSLIATLVRQNKRPWGLELAFQFSNPSNEYLDLVRNLNLSPWSDQPLQN